MSQPPGTIPSQTPTPVAPAPTSSGTTVIPSSVPALRVRGFRSISRVRGVPAEQSARPEIFRSANLRATILAEAPACVEQGAPQLYELEPLKRPPVKEDAYHKIVEVLVNASLGKWATRAI